MAERVLAILLALLIVLYMAFFLIASVRNGWTLGKTLRFLSWVHQHPWKGLTGKPWDE